MKDLLARFVASLLDKHSYLITNVNMPGSNRLMIDLVPSLGRVLNTALYFEVPRAEDASTLFVESFS